MLRLWLGCDEFRMIDRRSLFAAACVVGGIAANVVRAQEARTRFPIDSASVVAVMERKQLPTKDVNVSLGVAITTRTANPQLEIKSVALVGAHDMRMRISCHDRSECLPFFATATFPEAMNEKWLPAKLERAAGLTLASEKHVALANMADAGTVAARHEAAGATPILKAGSPAKLSIDEDRIHIQMDVISLADGAAGDKIRVTTRDHKQVYVAQIITPTLLKGSL